jgi:hypothetical protein
MEHDCQEAVTLVFPAATDDDVDRVVKLSFKAGGLIDEGIIFYVIPSPSIDRTLYHVIDQKPGDQGLLKLVSPDGKTVMTLFAPRVSFAIRRKDVYEITVECGK